MVKSGVKPASTASASHMDRHHALVSRPVPGDRLGSPPAAPNSRCRCRSRPPWPCRPPGIVAGEPLIALPRPPPCWYAHPRSPSPCTPCRPGCRCTCSTCYPPAPPQGSRDPVSRPSPQSTCITTAPAVPPPHRAMVLVTTSEPGLSEYSFGDVCSGRPARRNCHRPATGDGNRHGAVVPSASR